VAHKIADSWKAGNMHIEGDNPDALKALLHHYAGKVKLTAARAAPLLLSGRPVLQLKSLG